MPFYEQLREVYRLFIKLEEETVGSDFLSKMGCCWKKFRLYITLPSDVIFSLLSVVKIALEVVTWTEYINAERLNLVDYEYKIAVVLFLLILSNSKFSSWTCTLTLIPVYLVSLQTKLMIFEWQERFRSFILEIKLSERKRTVIKLTMITLSMVIHDCLHTFITYFFVLRLKPPSLNFTVATLVQLFINLLCLLNRNWKDI